MVYIWCMLLTLLWSSTLSNTALEDTKYVTNETKILKKTELDEKEDSRQIKDPTPLGKNRNGKQTKYDSKLYQLNMVERLEIKITEYEKEKRQ